jgi:hypothetical protein
LRNFTGDVIVEKILSRNAKPGAKNGVEVVLDWRINPYLQLR